MESRGNRDAMVVATKVGSLPTRPGLSAANIRAACEDSLRRLRTDRIDLYYAHKDDPGTAQEETLDAFDGLVREEILEARARGVLFDIGHGGASFGFDTTRKMLDAGFLPDVISSDVHALSIQGPAFDLLTTMSKFLCLGVDLPAVIRLVTLNAASAMGRPELGTLRPGAVGDATVLEVEDGKFDYADSLGEWLVGDRRLRSAGVVLGGGWWHPA